MEAASGQLGDSRRRPLEDQLPVLDADTHEIAFGELALEQRSASLSTSSRWITRFSGRAP